MDTSTCITPIDGLPQATPPSSFGAGRRAQAQAIRSALDTAADLINTQHAVVLRSVIEMQAANLHRTEFGFSALRDLLLSQFDFTFNTASAIAAIARLARKFTLLSDAATTGIARIDQVAYAVRQLDKTPAMRLFARTPFRSPAPSPFDPAIECATPEAMVAQYCIHAPFTDLRSHLDELWAAMAEETELFDALGEQSMQWITLAEQGNGMWTLNGELSEATGRLLDKYLHTACPPPRQDETDADGALPAQPNRHAEALHQLLAGYGTSPEAVTRHGHTATLDLVVDIETLQGKDTGRLPLLEGRPISVAGARLLACEAGIIPSVFDYATGEAVELGRALRLPNTALRRKLELEQPEGCAWQGCDRPVAWTEAHHITHWADGGPTVAANLILLCRFHHGRIHTPGWTVEKTGPGQALIVHHDGHDTSPEAQDGQGGQGSNSTGCGCADWRTDADMDAEHASADDTAGLFPTGLYRSEWSEMLTPDLNDRAEAAERDRVLAEIAAARARLREKFGTTNLEPAEQAADPTPTAKRAPLDLGRTARPQAKTPVLAVPVDYGEPPFLGCPSRWRSGRGEGSTLSVFPPETQTGSGPSPCPETEQSAHIPTRAAKPMNPPRPGTTAFVAAILDRHPIPPEGR